MSCAIRNFKRCSCDSNSCWVVGHEQWFCRVSQPSKHKWSCNVSHATVLVRNGAMCGNLSTCGTQTLTTSCTFVGHDVAEQTSSSMGKEKEMSCCACSASVVANVDADSMRVVEVFGCSTLQRISTCIRTGEIHFVTREDEWDLLEKLPASASALRPLAIASLSHMRRSFSTAR